MGRLREEGIVRRERTPLELVLWALFVYVNGCSLRRVKGLLEHRIRRSHVAIWTWVQQVGSRLGGMFRLGDLPDVLVVDGTPFMEGRRECYVWIGIDPAARAIVYVAVTEVRNLFTALGFFQAIRRRYGRLPTKVVTDAAMWYPWALRRLGIEHEVPRGGVRSYVERFNETLKDRARPFDK